MGGGVVAARGSEGAAATGPSQDKGRSGSGDCGNTSHQTHETT